MSDNHILNARDDDTGDIIHVCDNIDCREYGTAVIEHHEHNYDDAWTRGLDNNRPNDNDRTYADDAGIVHDYTTDVHIIGAAIDNDPPTYVLVSREHYDNLATELRNVYAWFNDDNPDCPPDYPRFHDLVAAVEHIIRSTPTDSDTTDATDTADDMLKG